MAPDHGPALDGCENGSRACARIGEMESTGVEHG